MYSAFLIRCGVHCTPYLFKKANPAKSFVAFLNTFNPINHDSGRIYPCFLQRPVAGKGLKWEKIRTFCFSTKNVLWTDSFLTMYPPKLQLYAWFRPQYRPSPEKSWAKTYPTVSERHKEEAFLSFSTDDHGLTENNISCPRFYFYSTRTHLLNLQPHIQSI